jgi:hypothetical protein
MAPLVLNLTGAVTLRFSESEEDAMKKIAIWTFVVLAPLLTAACETWPWEF